MSKLVSESAMKMLQEYDEAIINKKFNPYAFYQIVQIASTTLNEKIKDKEYKNALYRRLYQALEQEDIDKARKIIHQIKIEIDNDRGIINKYLEKQREEEENSDNTMIQVYDKKTIGYLSYFESNE